MTIEKAIDQIDNGTQEIPSNWHAGTGLSDGVTWAEVREWLASLTATSDVTFSQAGFHEAIREARAEGFEIADPQARNPFGGNTPNCVLAGVWQAAYWQGCADERSATEANIGYGPNRTNPYGNAV